MSEQRFPVFLAARPKRMLSPSFKAFFSRFTPSVAQDTRILCRDIESAEQAQALYDLAKELHLPFWVDAQNKPELLSYPADGYVLSGDTLTPGEVAELRAVLGERPFMISVECLAILRAIPMLVQLKAYGLQGFIVGPAYMTDMPHLFRELGGEAPFHSLARSIATFLKAEDLTACGAGSLCSYDPQGKGDRRAGYTEEVGWHAFEVLGFNAAIVRFYYQLEFTSTIAEAHRQHQVSRSAA